MLRASLFLLAAGCSLPDPVVFLESEPAVEYSSSWAPTWQVFTLSGPRTHYVNLAGVGQLAVEAEQGKISIYGNGTTWASNQTGRVMRRWLPAGTYAVTLTGTYGRAVVEPDVFDQVAVRPVADGVTWHRLIGANTSVNMLRVDASRVPDADVYDGTTWCTSVPTMGRAAGATAGINGTFSQVSAGRCMQWHAAIRYGNYAYGDVGGERPVLSLPGLEMEQLDDIWDAEGPSAISGSTRLLPFLGPNPGDTHPRTIVGVAADGDLMMMTIDGRTPAGAGASYPQAAAWAASWGMVDAMNADGGGSTTMWIDGATLSGVVNYPSDNHTWGYPDHVGARAVSDAIFVW